MSQIDFNTATSAALQGSQPNGFSELSSEEFIKIIFTELTNQDPLEPNDTSALLDQLNSIRSIESDLELTRQFEALVFENKLASASGMIGKFIGGLTDDAQRVAGYVVSAVRQGDSIFLELDNGWFLNTDRVETIIDPTLLDDAPDVFNPGGDGDDGTDADGDDASDDDVVPVRDDRRQSIV